MSKLLKEEQGYKERQVPTCGEENEDIYGDQWSSPSHASPCEVHGVWEHAHQEPQNPISSLLPRLVGLLHSGSVKGQHLQGVHYTWNLKYQAGYPSTQAQAHRELCWRPALLKLLLDSKKPKNLI